MRTTGSFLGLPASLILFIASWTNATADNELPVQWLHSRSRDFLQESPRLARIAKEDTTVAKSPVGIMKMSDDPNEKFYHEYWIYEHDRRDSEQQIPLSPLLRPRDLKEELRLSANASVSIAFRPPFSLHSNDQYGLQALRSRNAAGALSALEKRGFMCPVGTADCSAIGNSNACCATGETCFSITDTGLGSVACCPNGAQCGGALGTCQTPNTPCANGGSGTYQPGGCCIPNYVCAGVGCVLDSSLVVTVIVTETFTVGVSTSTRIGTTVTTRTTSTSPLTDTALQTTQTCSANWNACPVNFGGGCCENGYTCAPNTSCIAPSSVSTRSTSTVSVTTTSATAVPPIRPTTDQSTFVFPTTTSTPVVPTACPTGFYACSAFYRGGCCRTGRDCQTTDCPATASTTLIDGSVTVVVPVGSGAAVASPTGECATGWSSCAATLGGNCCPSGYACGTASCSLISPTQTAVVQKGSPNTATGNRIPLMVTILLVFGALVL